MDENLADKTYEQTEVDMNWDICCICQHVTDEHLQCPAQSKRTDIAVGAGYDTFARHVESCQEIRFMPVTLKVLELNTKQSLAELFTMHAAKWHKSCRNKFNNTKLTRAQKRACCEEHIEAGGKRTTRQSVAAPTSVNDDKCFFCDDGVTSGVLRKASTFKLDARVRKCAQTTEDTMLLAKLSAGDMVAQDAGKPKICS